MLPHKKLVLHKSFSVFVILCILISIFSATIYAIGSYGVDLSSAAYRGLNIYNSPQCTWYCWGRAYEKCGVSLPGFGNANNWYAAASSRGYSVGTAPAANSIAVFRDVGSATSGYGHVAFVEAISGTTAYITEGNYEGLSYHEDTFDCGNGVRWPNSIYQQNIIGYIYLAATPSQPLPAPNAPSVTVNGSSVTVSWAAVPGATGYNVFAEKDGITTQWASIASTGSTISETRNNLADGDYAVYIVAYNFDTNEKATSEKSYFTIRTKPVTYSVTLDTDGGTINSGNVTSYTEGIGATLPTDVTKDGYTFLGWFDGDTKVEVIDTTATGNKSFRAKWDPIDCSIRLYAVLDGVTASTPFYWTTAKYGSSLQTALSLIPTDVLELTAYTRDHAFYYATGSAVAPNATVDLSVILYVKYTTRTFTVSFDLNDGTGKTFAQTVAYGKTASEPETPKRSGYQFAGWYTSGRTQFDFSTPIMQNITLKASWRAVSAVSDSSSQPTGSTRQDSSDTLPFRDVSKSSWYYNSVKLAWEKGLISGITATQYKPEGTLSVAQAIKLAATLYQSHTEGSVRLTNGAPHWYDSYVRYAVDNSLLDKAYLSYTDKQMNAPIQRREFVHIFFRAADDLSACNVIADGKIPDISMTSQYAAEIYTFYRAGILSGSDSAGTFYPESNIRRSEVAAILVRLFDSSARLKLSLS